MGHRTLKRVPLDFDWPRNKVWEGYLNPHYRKCPDCDHGETKASETLGHLVHLILIAGEGAQFGELHPWLREAGVRVAPSKEMVELTTGLAGRAPMGRMGHDSCDRWRAQAKIVKAAGLPKNWGTCKTCGGNALDPAVRKKYKAWKEYDPPKGEGFQLWETCSEGSPVSPVFKTADELASWCADNATTFADFKATKEQWLKMFSTEDGVDVGSLIILSDNKFAPAIDRHE